LVNIEIDINPFEVLIAKKMIKEFDETKIFNKFVCKTNYIGLLGEIVFKRYLKEHNIEHEWIKFIKQNWNTPDFIIGGKTIDLKTTYSADMWVQQPKFDIYLYAQISKDDTLLTIKGWVTKSYLEEGIKSAKIRQVKRDSRVDYVIPTRQMLSLTWLSGVLSPTTL